MGSKEGNIMKYIISSTIYVTIDADDYDTAIDKADDYFNDLNFKGLDIDVDNDYDVEPIQEEE